MGWNLEIKNEKLSDLYDDYLYQQDNILIFYLSSVVLNDRTEISEEHFSTTIRASNNFHESATSIKTVGDIQSLIDSGEYIQLSRSFSIFGLVTAFTDFFQGLVKILELDIRELKPAVTVTKGRSEVKIKPFCLKAAFYIDDKFNLDTALAKAEAMIWLNCIINIRHMFVHEKGEFHDKYKGDMTLKWSRMEHGEKILFDENDFDSVLWYLNSHLKAFVGQLANKI